MGIVQQEWLSALSLQQQSVLLMACRGPDGMRKSHPAKALIQAYRASVLNAASTGQPLHINQRGDTYMNLTLLISPPAWRKAVHEYLYDVDEIPHHYHLHLLHGAQILGYKHPEDHVRECWIDFYRRGVSDMHLYPESESQMDARLNDFAEVPKTEHPDERLAYAFGHLVSGHARPEDAHAADSLDHGRGSLTALNLTPETIDIVEDLAVHVAGDYAYTGEATEFVRRINAGQI